jgi:hypothetical protein
MADSRSLRAADAPCMAVPPATVTLALGFGEEVLEDLVSEINCPAADGGSFAGGAGEIPRDTGVTAPDDVAVVGFCTASGVSDSPNILVLPALVFELPAM